MFPDKKLALSWAPLGVQSVRFGCRTATNCPDAPDIGAARLLKKVR